ncbi:MAG: DUF962 domain-containing protein [Bacteroidetes bacterium]|nr:DUF962 domain-containing protein [Bacteroidota bacterium]
MKQIGTWLSEYDESHRNKTNKLIHWICVPLIFFSVTGFLYSIKLPYQLNDAIQLNVGFVAMLLVFFYYALLSWRLSIGMLLFGMFCLHCCNWIEVNVAISLLQVCLFIFVFAWIGQFYGHKIEGKKPSFLKDIQFLLIGPAWLMHFIYQKIGIRL